MSSILVVGTHPDDVELGLGGSVAKWVKAGYDVAILDLTNGEPTPFGDPVTRAEEAKRSTSVLGVTTRINLGLPNRTLTETVESRRAVAEVYRELKPDLLFIHGSIDAHPDHLAGSQICFKARFDAKLTKTEMRGAPWYPKKMFDYNASHLASLFDPTFILDVTETFATKIEAIKCYRSQFHATGNEEMILNKIETAGRFYGEMIGITYGEPIKAREPLGLADTRDIIR